MLRAINAESIFILALHAGDEYTGGDLIELFFVEFAVPLSAMRAIRTGRIIPGIKHVQTSFVLCDSLPSGKDITWQGKLKHEKKRQPTVEAGLFDAAN